ncbi:hypothetical protein BQ8794_280060 [Mesorhizobium prunaredense]|uniref:Periplasmic protein-like protein n=1 Tax=Mesorhizobium prunaredense TaxID=1631249 RepID=A0A1R3VC17_9HYPH|nr:hypothetical protein [Mesorhizobium prunaredense]SIT56321.1 hypothetical protein BQ8794_280060 [Mesorhizobium prunaredense]
MGSFYRRCTSTVIAITILAIGVLPAAAEDLKHANDKPMTFKVFDHPPCSACVVVFASGEVADTTIERFQEALDRLEKTSEWSRAKARTGTGPQLILLLDSPGGLVNPAFSVSRQLRINGAMTAVARPSVTFETDGALDPSSCNSACGLMLLGGKVRFSRLLSNIGLHQIRPAVEQKLSYTREEVLLYLTVFKESAAALSRHLVEMNIDPKLLLYIMQAPDDEMGFLGYSEAKSLGVIDAIADSLNGILHYPS